MEILDEFKLEIQLLQKNDYDAAIENGFNNKKDWYEFIINQDEDIIAEEIINIANRYDVLIENVANIFDPTMIMRVGKVIQKKKEENFKK